MSDVPGADRIAAWDAGDVVYVAALPRGPVIVLEGTAMTIWREAATGPLESAADRVARAMGLEVDEIRDTVDQFVGGLVAKGLLSRGP